MARSLIIGYGNPLRSDDGFGWHATQKLTIQLHYADVEIITRHQLTPELAETASHFHLVISHRCRSRSSARRTALRESYSQRKPQPIGSVKLLPFPHPGIFARLDRAVIQPVPRLLLHLRRRRILHRRRVHIHRHASRIRSPHCTSPIPPRPAISAALDRLI